MLMCKNFVFMENDPECLCIIQKWVCGFCMKWVGVVHCNMG
jgi:hypothetical protein